MEKESSTSESSSSNDNIKILGALLLGAAIGVGLGILFAPDKGSETRKKIMKSGEDLKDDFSEKLNDFVEGVKDKFEEAKAKVADLNDKK